MKELKIDMRSPGATKTCSCGGKEPPEAPAGKKEAQGSGGVSQRPVPKVSPDWTASDYLGAWRARTSGYRMRYHVEPGLFRVGEPDENADVFVTANYKLSFDILRRALRGLSAWILVLDTGNINVWCAAGKGTFGTEELVRRIRETELRGIVAHRRVILPQLGAPGVSAADVKKTTGFRVSFGPVRADDIPAYVRAGYRADRAMRTVTFPLRDRLVLTPMELNPALKRFFPIYALVVLIFFGLQAKPAGILLASAWADGAPFLALGFLSILAGALLVPALLPYIPFRSFALKGFLAGAVLVFFLRVAGSSLIPPDPRLRAAAALFVPLFTSFVALQFTGSTTFTGMSGVKKELRYAVPVYLSGVVVVLGLLTAFKLKTWGLL